MWEFLKSRLNSKSDAVLETDYASKNKVTLYCSFCGKSQHEVSKLITNQNDVQICDECVDLTVDVLEKEGLKQNIQRSLEFEPEHRQAGLGILNYFAEYVEKQYPDIKTKVQIRQERNKVQMIIETLKGKKDVVEKTLEEFALIVTGKKPPEDCIDNPLFLLEMKQRLEIANLQLSWSQDQNRLIQRVNDSLQQTIQSQNRQVDSLNKCLRLGLTNNANLASAIEKLSQATSNSTVQIALNRLFDLLEKGLTEADEEIAMKQLKQIQQDDPATFDELCTLAHNLASGTASSLLANWIGTLNAVLPS